MAEITRAAESKKRVREAEAKEKAIYDYILANAIGYSISRLYSNSAKMPSLAELYPSLFNDIEVKEQEQKTKDELSAMRFIQFANSFNKKLEKGEQVNVGRTAD